MLDLILILASFGAFLLILMPPTAVGILSAAAMFVAGAAFAIYKKSRRARFFRCGKYYYIPIALGGAMYFGKSFYERWNILIKA